MGRISAEELPSIDLRKAKDLLKKRGSGGAGVQRSGGTEKTVGWLGS